MYAPCTTVWLTIQQPPHSGRLFNILVCLAKWQELVRVLIAQLVVRLGGRSRVIELSLLQLALKFRRVATPDFCSRDSRTRGHDAARLEHGVGLEESTLLHDAAIPYGDVVLDCA